MTLLAPTLEAFFTQHLAGHGRPAPAPSAPTATPGGCSSATPCTTGTAPAGLDIAALDAGLVSSFLAHLEQEPGQHRPDAQRATGRDPVGLQVRRPAPPRARCDDRPGPRDPREEARPGLRLLPHRRRDQGPARRPGHHDVARPPRPRVPRPCRPDRAAVLRAHRAHPRRRPDRDRTTVRCHGKGRKDRVTPLTANTAAMIRTWLRQHARRARRSAVPDHYGPAAVLRRRPGPGRTAHRDRGGGLPVHPGQKRHPAHPAAFRGHGPAACRGDHRPSPSGWGTRAPGRHSRTSTPTSSSRRRPWPGPRRRRRRRQVPPARQAPRVPRGPGIMPLA